jgi:hypothetical protein
MEMKETDSGKASEVIKKKRKVSFCNADILCAKNINILHTGTGRIVVVSLHCYFFSNY